MQTEPVDPALISLLAFWADAGVETAFAEAPVDRMLQVKAEHARGAEPAGRAAPPAPAPAPRSGAPPANIAAEVARAQALARGAPDLQSLWLTIEAFQTPGRRPNAPTVLFRGNAQARVVVIGEGPTAEDEAAGAPFAGRSGALLDRMLAAADLSDGALLMTTSFWRAGERDAADLTLICSPFIERAIALAAPAALLVLGEAALRSVLRDRAPILTARGRWTDWRSALEPDLPPVPALPTLHPGFLLRHPAAKKRAWADLLSLTEKLAGA